MLNKVILEGEVTRSSWGINKEEGGYFLNIKQERFFNKFKTVYSFSAYANKPLAGQLAKIIESNPGCKVIIEGRLRTYFSKKDNLYHTTILIEKLVNWTPANTEVTNTTNTDKTVSEISEVTKTNEKVEEVTSDAVIEKK